MLVIKLSGIEKVFLDFKKICIKDFKNCSNFCVKLFLHMKFFKSSMFRRFLLQHNENVQFSGNVQ